MTEDLETTHVVTVFLRHDADVLLCRRGDEAGSDSGRWEAVVGEEMREETELHLGVDATRPRRGDPFDVTDPDLGRRRVVHPFLCEATTREVTTNDETVTQEWVPPTAILRRETVPDLWTAYDRVRPTVETVTADRDHGSAYLSVRALEVLRDEAALAAERDAGEWADLAATARALRDARPAMPVVANRVNRVMAAAVERAGNDRPVPATVERAAGDELDRALAADDRAAARAAELLPPRVATLSRSGTVLAALERADPAFVLVAESRPGREGVATAEALAAQTTADVTLTIDAALADEIAVADVGALVVGADAVLPDGRVVNKVGTRGAACVTASECAVYVVAAGDKVATDGSVDREERPAAEVYDGDVELSVANPTFGVTPPGCLDAVVTEDGVLDEAGVHELADAHRERARWDAGNPTG